MSTKRILSLVLALVMVLGTFSTMVFAETGNDKVDWLVDQGIVKGDEKGELKLDATIDRASVAKLVVEALDLGAVAEGMKGYKTSFSDVPVTHWANGYINVVSARGIMIGDAGKFMPGNQISYAEVLTILVRIMDGLTADEEKVAVWPTTYIAKANELGILKDVTVVSYQEPAIRERIFEMFYNAMNNMEVGNYSIVKAIVLENNRVERIGSGEVVVEVIRELQRANYADASRYEQGDQERFTIDLKGQNVEEMLGKVYDFTLNKDGKVVSVKLDTSYNYYAGPVTASKDKLTLGATGYTVEMGERYKGTDERIFRTYHNDIAYQYADFYQNPGKINMRNRDNSFSVDYARFTVKNGKVLFIDAYTFTDISPVQEVKRDGQDVYVYNDYKNAKDEKYTPGTLVIGFNNGVFSRINRADIRPNDVVHVYANGKLIVRQDAVVEGTYHKVEKDRWNDYYAHVGDDAYYIADEDYFRPVYAHDSKSFATLYAASASSILRNFHKEEVTILIDINEGLQLFGADVAYNEGMAIVEQILARGEGKFVQPSNERLILNEDYYSSISFVDAVTGKTTTNQKLNVFNTRDLVFLLGDADNKIDTLVRVRTEAEMRGKDNENLRELKSVTATDMNNSFIRLKNESRIQVLDRTNVFVIDANGAISGTTVGKLQSSLRPGTELSAFILSDKEFRVLLDDRDINIFDRYYGGNRVTNEDNIAHTIVFFAPTYGINADLETVLVTNVYTGNVIHELRGQLPGRVDDQRVITRLAAHRGISFADVKTNDIVRLYVTKDDDKFVQKVDTLIAAGEVNTNSWRVVGFGENYSASEYRRLYLVDAKNEPINDGRGIWVTRTAKEFGTVELNSVITFHTDLAGDIDTMRVYPKNTPVTANGGPAPVVQYPILVSAYQRLGSEVTVVVDELDNRGNVVTRSYNYVGAQDLADLVALEGKPVTLSKFTISGETLVNLVTLRTTEEPGNGGDNGNGNDEEPGEDEITAEAKLVVEVLGVRSYDLTVTGAEVEDVTKLLVDGKDIDFDVVDGVIQFNLTEGAPTLIEIEVDGNTVAVEIK